MQLNVLAPMQLTNLLAPGMQQQQWGIIINMGSVAAGGSPRIHGGQACDVEWHAVSA